MVVAIGLYTHIFTNLVLTSKVECNTRKTILADGSIRIKELSGLGESIVLIILILTRKFRLETGGGYRKKPHWAHPYWVAAQHGHLAAANKFIGYHKPIMATAN